MVANQNQIQLPTDLLDQQDPPRASANSVETLRDYVNPSLVLVHQLYIHLLGRPISTFNQMSLICFIVFNTLGSLKDQMKILMNMFSPSWCFANMINHEGISVNAFRLRLFPHTLKECAREWSNSINPGSIVLWNDMMQKFSLKFFLSSRVH